MVRLVIDDKEYTGFTIDNLSLMYNTIASTFGFSGLDDYSPIPGRFPKVQIYHFDELILTGVVVNQEYETQAKPTLVSVSGYSKAGILEDCTIPLSLMPMQIDNMSLKEICDKILPYFGLNYSTENVVRPEIFKKPYKDKKTKDNNIDESMNKKFKKLNFNYEQTIKSAIVELATERGIYVNHMPNGDIRFTDSSTDNLDVIAHFEDDGLTAMKLTVNTQIMHSEISVLSSNDEDSKLVGEYTIKNPYITNINRPIIHKMKKGDSMDVQEYARVLLSSELRGISLTVNTRKFVKPGNIISVKSDRLRIHEDTIFFVEKTDIKADAKGMTYEMQCVIKDVYSKKPVVNEFIL